MSSSSPVATKPAVAAPMTQKQEGRVAAEPYRPQTVSLAEILRESQGGQGSPKRP